MSIIGVRLVVLVDNGVGTCDGLRSEHGLSLWVEADGYKWLVDTGESDAFAQNAIRLDIDIAEADYLLLSHAHCDHCGGLETFLSLNNKARILLSARIGENRYYSTRRGVKRDISLNHTLVADYAHRFMFIDKDIALTPNVSLLTSFGKEYSQPKANTTLLKNDLPDDFDHEIAMAINTHSGVTIISPCSHNGVLNTIESCSHIGEVCTYIGGTHLVDGYEEEMELHTIAVALKHLYPQLTLVTGHCTGEMAKQQFRKELNGKFIEFYTGFSLK